MSRREQEALAAGAEGELSRLIARIDPVDGVAAAAARDRWNAIGKPVGGLGLLEDAVCRMAAAQAASGTAAAPDAFPTVEAAPRALAVFCADNGVVAEGVTQAPCSVTAVGARSLGAGTACVCQMARAAGCAVRVVDVGMARPVDAPGVEDRAVRRGTGDIATGPAMTREEAARAMITGAEVVRELASGGCRLIAAGEMGIGNTATSAAVASALLGRDPAELTGTGSGLPAGGLARKVAVIRRALGVNGLAPGATGAGPRDPLAVIAAVGGLDIAAMCGFYLGAAAERVPVVLDGLISCAAALAAARLAPACAGYLLASHEPSEPAAPALLTELGLRAPLRAGLHLGEGTGAVALMPLLDLALAVYRSAATFEDLAMDAYDPADAS